jgi:hypothetical protein
LLHEVEVAGREFSVAFPRAWETRGNGDTAIAIGSYESSTLFHRIEITPP